MYADTRRQRPKQEYSRQTDLNDFGFVPATQLRIDDLDRDLDANKQNQEAAR